MFEVPEFDRLEDNPSFPDAPTPTLPPRADLPTAVIPQAFIHHARGTTMASGDVDQAFCALNIEPLYGHSPHNLPTFRRSIPYPPNSTTGTLYFVEGEVFDFDPVLREGATSPKPVSWTTHWLAVEGVQPLISENLPPVVKDTEEPPLKPITGQPSASTSAVTTQSTVEGRQQNQQLVKQVLSRELRFYYARFTSSLLPPISENYAKRTAALTNLRHDAGLTGSCRISCDGLRRGRPYWIPDRGWWESYPRIIFPLPMHTLPALSTVTPVLSILLHSSLPRTHSTHLRKFGSTNKCHFF